MKILLIKLVLTIALIAFLATRVDLGAAFMRLGTLSVPIIVLGLLIGLFQISLLAYRWMLVSKVTGLKLPLPEALRCSLASQFFSQGLPASVGGDALRLWWLTRLGIALRHGMQSILLDRIAGLVALVVLSLFAMATLLIATAGFASDTNIAIAVGAIALLLVIGASRRMRATAVCCYQFLPTAWQHQRIVRRVMHWLLKLHRGTEKLFFTRKGLVILGWGVAIHLSAVALCFLVANNVDIAVSFYHLFSVVPLVMLLSYLPLSIGGWGLRESSMALGLSLVGVPTEDGVFIGLAMGSIVLGAALIGALVWVFSPMPVSILGRRRVAAEV